MSITIFKEFITIPHCSFHTEGLRQYLEDFTKQYADIKVDKAGNIHCIKGKPKICLQAHYDMVCVGAAPDVKVYEEDGFLKARNSTLGADNGIGLAIALKALKTFDNLELLITNDEEVGLIGALNLEHKIHSTCLLNLDSDRDTEVVIGCAGSVDIHGELKVSRIKQQHNNIYKITAKGFEGGHSGIDIIKNKKNSIKELAKFIKQNNATIIEFNAGERQNSIARQGIAKVASNKEIKANDLFDVEQLKQQEVEVIKESNLILSLINSIPQGVRAFDEKLNIVKTSINLSTANIENDVFKISFMARSSSFNDLENTAFETKSLLEALGATCKMGHFSKVWQPTYNEFSTLVLETLREVKGQEVKLSALHAGLECSLFDPKIFMASIGPNIYNAHSTDEKCEIKSIKLIEEVAFKVIEKMNAKD